MLGERHYPLSFASLRIVAAARAAVAAGYPETDAIAAGPCTSPLFSSTCAHFVTVLSPYCHRIVTANPTQVIPQKVLRLRRKVGSSVRLCGAVASRGYHIAWIPERGRALH